ncbi:ATP-dependent DNA helicase [Trichonephila clavipes]|nr:ATP-dependent DNA helicase [Trichonephila clavipes]
MEIYNRFSNTDGFCNAYIACASTGKAAVAIDGTTVHTAFKITLSRLLPLSIEVAHQYRALFKFIKVIIIDEVSMISAELLGHIDSRLKQITGNYNTNFGGLDMILIGDLRQLPPVRATPIYK